MLTFTNAKLFDGSRMRTGRHSVTVDGNRIATVGPEAPVGADRVIDLDGMTVMPGMITGHFHPDFFRYQYVHNMAGIMVGNELPPGVLMAIAIRNAGVLLESGFTGYIGASCSNDIDAQLKLAISEGIVAGPRIRACGHHIGTTASINDHRKWWLRPEIRGQDLFGDGPEGMRKLVREDIRRGAQTIKIFASSGHGFPGAERPTRNMAREEIDMVVRTAHECGAKVRAHVSGKEFLLECIELGVDILDHGDWIDEEVIEQMVDRGTYWVPSFVYPKIMCDLGIGDTDFIRREQEHAQGMLPVAQRAGVRILIGDDYSGVFREALVDDPLDHQVGNYAREFAFYAAMDGLSAADVLTWGTRNAGQLLADGSGDVTGVVEPGALADLIVVDGDPVEDPTILAAPQQHLKAVMVDGALTLDRLPVRSDRALAV
jgi:imidazolonepropionase-like amidohydrolase